ncbi:radical SAM protein [Fervidobacterium pennivorans subsp. shakshaketiis]|uniref:Fe-S oxidoreductase n=1 Tax=Fervidobacterium pennivorans (strain DSM 9078 / Ven5) TaxID=771875 RepID=H9UCP3_FERPD|nr:radical SAM protein [Fervidobacterium pennivorans]AFG35286.1 putative Fe-S oxidoreductase [Fervidobacterium pennivorans DSM 9078]QIV78351.1 radical SAM protein [Fervidobacterium pennivorans subsp. keratinolyticus]
MTRERPHNIEFEITTACNYQCIHCYCNAGPKSKNELSTERVKSVIDQLVEANTELLDIVGGEPLVRSDIYEILSYGCEKGLQMMMNTNASLVTKQVARKLKEACPNLLIGVSLDGPTPEIHEKIRGRGTFDKTMNGMVNLLNEGFDVTILFVVNALNYKYIDDMLKLAESLGTHLYVDRFVPVGRGLLHKDLLMPTKEQIQYVAKKLEEYNGGVQLFVEENIFGGECSAGKTHASILVDGTVVPCGHFRYSPEFYMGNINEKPFKEIWYSYDQQSIVPKQCSTCPLYKVSCHGGCFAYSHLIYQTSDLLVCKVL